MEVVRRTNAEIVREIGTVAYFIRMKRKEKGFHPREAGQAIRCGACFFETT